MHYRPEPHTLFGRVRGKLLWLLAWPALLIDMRRRRRSLIWIGDSHAMSVNRSITNSMFMRAPDGGVILRAGAKLMYSLAREGFPERVLRVVRVVNRFGRPGSLVPVFCAGEIDVRVHLAERPDETFDFVRQYVDQCAALAEQLRADRLAVVVPIPPVDVVEEKVGFPVRGSIGARLRSHARVRIALHDAVAAIPHAVVIDHTDFLVDATGAMPEIYTSDGAHTNARVVPQMRARVAASGLLD